jgi:hypothetical protein
MRVSCKRWATFWGLVATRSPTPTDATSSIAGPLLLVVHGAEDSLLPVGSIYSFSALTWSFTGRQRVGTIGETGGSRLVEVPNSGATAPPLSREAAG